MLFQSLGNSATGDKTKSKYNVTWAMGNAFHMYLSLGFEHDYWEKSKWI